MQSNQVNQLSLVYDNTNYFIDQLQSLLRRIQDIKEARTHQCIDFSLEKINLNIDYMTTYHPTKFPSVLGCPAPWSTDLLEDLTFKNLTFKDCDLSHLSLRHATFEDVTFQNCTIRGASFEQATLRNVIFSGGSITDTSFHDADLIGVEFKELQFLHNYSIGLREQQVSYDAFCEIRGCSHFFGNNDRKNEGPLVLIPWTANQPSHSISMVIDQVKNYGGTPLRYDYRYFLDEHNRYQLINQDALEFESNEIFLRFGERISPEKIIESIAGDSNFPVINGIISTAEKYATVSDRVILPGGADIDPRFYGQTAGPNTKCGPSTRDWYEMALLNACKKHSKKTLGICRGMQMIHIWAGGDLEQHRAGYEGKILNIGSEEEPNNVFVYFHQTPTGPTPGFKITAGVQTENGSQIILGIEHLQEGWHVIGVKFHPECKRPDLPAKGGQADFAAKLSDYNSEIFKLFLAWPGE